MIAWLWQDWWVCWVGRSDFAWAPGSRSLFCAFTRYGASHQPKPACAILDNTAPRAKPRTRSEKPNKRPPILLVLIHSALRHGKLPRSWIENEGRRRLQVDLTHMPLTSRRNRRPQSDRRRCRRRLPG